MREAFHNELESIADGLVEMAEKATKAMEGSVEALLNNDLELAQQIISDDDSIDGMQAALDRRSAEVLALQAPVAADLRAVIAALKVAVAIERMGDRSGASATPKTRCRSSSARSSRTWARPRCASARP